nr:MAK10-like protein [Tanacetum cinerariifolium]
MFVELIKKYDDFSEEELEEDDNVVTGEELEVEYFDKFPTRSELVYHKYLICALISSLFLRNPIIVGGGPSNLKISCNIRHVHVGKAYIILNSLIKIMTRMQYNWIMSKHLEPRVDLESLRGISNFIKRVKGMNIFVGNFTYVSNFKIAEDISSAIDPRLSQVVLRKPFDEISDMTYDLSPGIVKYTNGTDETAYKMPHKIEQFDSLSNMEKEHTQ